MINSIKNETTLLDAFETLQDMPYTERAKLSFGQKINRVVSDYALKFFAYILGVKTSGRSVDDLIQKYDAYADAEEQNPSWCRNQKVILILHIEGSIPTDPEHFKKLKKQSGYKIVFGNLNSIEDSISDMADLKRKGCQIEALWIRAHGTPTTITFGGICGDQLNIGEEGYFKEFYLKKATSFCEAINNNLELEAPIILESCFTGKPMPDEKENIATFISRTAQRKVFAPKREAINIDDGVTFSKEKGFNVEIRSFQADHYFTPQSFLAKLSAIWLVFRGYKEDITQVIVPPKLA